MSTTILNKIQEGVASGEIHMADCLDMESWRLSFWNPRGDKAIACQTRAPTSTPIG